MPYLFLCLILAHVDRINVGFAKLQMQQDLTMSDSVYGLGAGIFLSAILVRVPANIIMRKIGARLWLGPIMILWAWPRPAWCSLAVQPASMRCVPSGRGGIWLLSRCDALPHLLVPDRTAPRRWPRS